MKNILAIIGSPRKGETYKAVERFSKELERYEPIQIEYIMLRDYALSDCYGCHNCIKKGEEFCHENIKIKALADKMHKADGVILATPVYNQQVTALMKKFMDYLTFLWHRPEMFGVKFFGISSGGGMFKPVFKYLRMNVESWGGTWIGELGVPHYEALTDKYRKKADQDVIKKTEVFLNGIKDKSLPKPTFNRLIWFNMWKMNAVAAKEDIVRDYEHWNKTDWINRDYYYDIKIGVHMKIALKAVIKLMRSFMRRVYRGY